METKKVAVVDGSNIAYIEKSKGGDPKVSNLVAVRQALLDRGYHPVVIVDASLRHLIDDPDQLESLIERQLVRQAPAGTDADFFVLATADEQGGIVISNDQYGPYAEQYPWLGERRMPLMIIEGIVELYENPPGG